MFTILVIGSDCLIEIINFPKAPYVLLEYQEIFQISNSEIWDKISTRSISIWLLWP
jgi:hypothetical protein